MTKFFTVMTAVFLLAPPQAARAMGPPVLSFGCAPWDGRTLEMNIAAPDALYQVQIWGKGMEALRKGKRTIVIDAKSDDPKGTGRASFNWADSERSSFTSSDPASRTVSPFSRFLPASRKSLLHR